MKRGNRRYLKRLKNPDHYVFVYFGAEEPNYWYIRIGGETPKFRHGLALAQSFLTNPEAVVDTLQGKTKEELIELLKSK